jgi:ABC-type multidrug transport system fused ATPase/permease subunit
VSQEPIVFDASVRDNLRYLRREATQQEIEQACRAAFADEFIEAMPEGYDTRLGEGGARMSGGQRQRLVLARAYLARPSILILDEPTSALDYDSERKVQRALEGLVKELDITLIVIAHRLSTVRNADHVIVLRDGRVIEAGAPAELNRTDSWFAAVMSADHSSMDNDEARGRRERTEDPADISV